MHLSNSLPARNRSSGHPAKGNFFVLKILHVIDSGGLYGAENVLLELALEQTATGHRALIASVGDLGVGEKALDAAREP